MHVPHSDQEKYYLCFLFCLLKPIYHVFHPFVIIFLQGGGAEVRETALHVAASNGYLSSSELLLKHSADPNAADARGETPLHRAAAALSAPVMRVLLVRNKLRKKI